MEENKVSLEEFETLTKDWSIYEDDDNNINGSVPITIGMGTASGTNTYLQHLEETLKLKLLQKSRVRKVYREREYVG